MYNPLCFCTRSEVLGSLLVTRIMTNKNELRQRSP
uniref:Uncharacterized protein n=1 Tax=Anguilla anguilla TaxID=7936 RepID=A0A0E9QU42_ANGAN